MATIVESAPLDSAKALIKLKYAIIFNVGKEEQTPMAAKPRAGLADCKGVMIETDITEGPHRTAKGLRHGFGVNAIQRGTPLNLLCRWVVYGSLEVTAIYANAVGKEEADIAARIWK